ncbi:polymer-forming cytoskeletal protein [Halomarina salina]|uniref:Polymer-forming cytoskeletal protein n=1 Tax=Halomarina salina TaxID=1872699 RepID=A0ABD5RMW7_9EURY|nr:polymer-forming cytoskeletal protein [Halomarina salina]
MIGRRAIRSVLVVLLVAVVVLGGMPGLAAAETRSGGSVVVGENEVVNDDLQVFAGSVVIRGTINGDVEGAAGTVRIEGTVNGDVNVGAGTVELAEGAVVDGSLNAGAGDVVIAGTVRGDANVGGDTVRLLDTAVVGGDLSYDGELVRADGAVVAGTVTATDGGVGPVDFGPLAPVFAFYGLLASLLLGAVLLLVFPRTADRVSATALAEPFRSGGTGLLTLVGIPLVLVLFAVTIIGIPITIVGALLFAVVAWVATVYGRLALGNWLLGFADVRNRWAGLLVGFLVVFAVGYVPVLGGVVDFLVLLLGLGALALVVYRAYRGRSDERASEPPVVDDDTGRPTV